MLSDFPIVDRRVAARVAVERVVSVMTDGGVHEAVTVNLSTSGVLLACPGALTIWADVAVDLGDVGLRSARVARRDADRYGLVFREPLSGDEFAAFTGVAMAGREPADAVADGPKRVARVSPWAFGRDRLKTLKRQAAERAEVERRR